jgi:hypothetical protein
MDQLFFLRKKPMSKIIPTNIKAAARYEQLLRTANKQYAALRKNPEAWKETLAEREEWDVMLGDGLEQEPRKPI